MFQILLENILLTAIIIALILLSVILQVLIGVVYQRLINETENLSTTENKYLKLCKLKFQNCYQLNGNVPNISVFVDRFISRLGLFRLSLNSLRRLCSQIMMLSVFAAGVGISMGIISGETMYRLLPYYILAIVGLYIYYSVAALVDIPGRREILKINLMDHLENHLLSRLKNNLAIDDSSPLTNSIARNPAHKPLEDSGDNSHGDEKIVKIPLDNKAKAPEQFSEDEIEELLKELIV
ncbi:MAG: hypothetical protein FWG91_02910 [Lachnospiraceae bacterium]|nr:hypothetical protein [Lachnospiraceae bacterium]